MSELKYTGLTDEDLRLGVCGIKNGDTIDVIKLLESNKTQHEVIESLMERLAVIADASSEIHRDNSILLRKTRITIAKMNNKKENDDAQR